MGTWANFKALVDLGIMDYNDVTLITELTSSNPKYRVLKLEFTEKTVGSMDKKMVTTSTFELKHNEKYYEETETLENSYVKGNTNSHQQ